MAKSKGSYDNKKSKPSVKIDDMEAKKDPKGGKRNYQAISVVKPWGTTKAG